MSFELIYQFSDATVTDIMRKLGNNFNFSRVTIKNHEKKENLKRFERINKINVTVF